MLRSWDFWDHTGRKDGGEGCSQLPARQRGWKSWISPVIPMDVGPVVTQPGWFPACPVPQDFGIRGTALWAVQRHCSCFSQVLVPLPTLPIPFWIQMSLFGLLSREALPATAESWIGIGVSQRSVSRGASLCGNCFYLGIREHVESGRLVGILLGLLGLFHERSTCSSHQLIPEY